MMPATETDTFDQATIEEMDARKRLAALKLLQTKSDKLEERKKARRDYWRNILTEKTTALHEAIDAPLPVDDAACRVSLRNIKSKRGESEDAKAEKKVEMDDLKAAIKRLEETMTELIVKDPSSQMSLELGEGMTAWLTGTVADQVNLALSEREALAQRDGDGEMHADLVSLRQELASLGIDAIPFNEVNLDDYDEDDDLDEEDEAEDEDDVEEEDETDDDDEVDGEDEVEEEDDNVIDLAGTN